MFAVLAEDDSDAEVLYHIIKQYYNDERLTVKTKGYQGGPGLCKDGARDIDVWLNRGIKFFVVCHDADTKNPHEVREEVARKVLKSANARSCSCVIVPVQEIEAWLIADEQAINRAIPSFRFKGHDHPESISSPKEWLVNESKKRSSKPLYAPTIFNPKVAKHLRHNVVARKCPSFKVFTDYLNAVPLA